MLRGMRQAGQSMVGKIIATILFCLLIGSFAVWGIGDIFRATPPSVVAKIGKTEISREDFRVAYNNELQRLGRQFRTVITPEQARLFGVDQRVLSSLITQAVMAEETKRLGLSVSDQLVARSIMEEPSFRGADGQFNRAMFDQLLRNGGLSEVAFVQEQRGTMTRTQLVEAIIGDLTVPTAARDAMHRYATERRAASYFVLMPAMAGEIPAPTAEQLQSFFTERKTAFRAPEYRAVNVLTLDAASVAKPDQVSDADARQRYEQEKAKFGSPEKRTIQQISFPNQEEAEAAFKRIKEGATFEAVAEERKVPSADLDLGTFTKQQMLDPVVAESAFALEQGATSGPLAGRFGPVIIRVTQVQPEAVRPFEEVAGEIRSEMASGRAKDDLEAAHDAIEDLRASARPLADIAKEKGLTLAQIPAVDTNGLDKSGKAVDVPNKDTLLKAAFASDIGVDNEALRLPNGSYVWFDVTGIEAARDKTLDEVKDEVARLWKEEEVAQRLSAKAREFTERLDKGDAFDAVAKDAGAPAKSATDLARNTAKDDLSAEVVNRIFAVPVGKSGNAANGANGRAVFKVDSATVPPMVTTTQDAQRIEEQLRNGMGDDLISQYVAQMRQELGVTINQQAMRQAIGGEI